VRHLHRELALRLNCIDTTPGRRVMVRILGCSVDVREIVARAIELRASERGEAWLDLAGESVSGCSAPWFETNA
jgi:hypothetical protein